MHITLFKYSTNDKGYLQVVTHEDNKPELVKAGFVDHVDKVKAPAKKTKRGYLTLYTIIFD